MKQDGKKKMDCFAMSPTGKCCALKETYCARQGKCIFYKTEEQRCANDATRCDFAREHWEDRFPMYDEELGGYIQMPIDKDNPVVKHAPAPIPRRTQPMITISKAAQSSQW